MVRDSFSDSITACIEHATLATRDLSRIVVAIHDATRAAGAIERALRAALATHGAAALRAIH